MNCGLKNMIQGTLYSTLSVNQGIEINKNVSHGKDHADQGHVNQIIAIKCTQLFLYLSDLQKI